MFLLQSNRHMTAQDIARELNVSERTVYRDIDALSGMGIPVYSQPGTNGGLFLDEDYHTTLTGLSQDQVLSLFASTEAGPLGDIGLGRAVKDGLSKLFHTLPAPQQREIERMRQRFHIDPVSWFNFGDTSAALNQLQTAVWQDKQVEISYQPIDGDVQTSCIDAYALVAKADKWYLVGRKTNGDFRTYRLTRLHGLTVLEATYERDPSFDLVTYWRTAGQQFQQHMAETFPPYLAHVRVHPEVFRYLSRYLDGSFTQTGEPAPDDWIEVDIHFTSLRAALTHVMALGSMATVVSPDELRHELVAAVREILARYAV